MGSHAKNLKPATVLILGATGLVGGRCLDRFLESEHFATVVTLTRSALSTGSAGRGHVNHAIDFDAPESYRDKTAADVVVCALGTTIKKAGSREQFRRVDFDYAFELAKAARESGARHLLLVSAKGAAADSRFFYNRVKGDLETAVAGLGYECLSIFRPSLLQGDRQEFRAGEVVGNFLARLFSFVVPLQWKPTPADRLAEAILNAAIDGRSGKNVYESGEILAGRA